MHGWSRCTCRGGGAAARAQAHSGICGRCRRHRGRGGRGRRGVERGQRHGRLARGQGQGQGQGQGRGRGGANQRRRPWRGVRVRGRGGEAAQAGGVREARVRSSPGMGGGVVVVVVVGGERPRLGRPFAEACAAKTRVGRPQQPACAAHTRPAVCSPARRRCTATLAAGDVNPSAAAGRALGWPGAARSAGAAPPRKPAEQCVPPGCRLQPAAPDCNVSMPGRFPPHADTRRLRCEIGALSLSRPASAVQAGLARLPAGVLRHAYVTVAVARVSRAAQTGRGAARVGAAPTANGTWPSAAARVRAERQRGRARNVSRGRNDGRWGGPPPPPPPPSKGLAATHGTGGRGGFQAGRRAHGLAALMAARHAKFC